MVDAATNLADCVVNHLVVVGIKGWKIFQTHPFQTMLDAETVVVIHYIDEGTVGDRDNSFTWVTVDAAEGSHLSDI